MDDDVVAKYLGSFPVQQPTLKDAKEIFFPNCKSISTGQILDTVVGIARVSATISGGASGSPAFFDSVEKGKFDAYAHGGSTTANCNLFVRTDSQKFLLAWKELRNSVK